MRRFTIGILVLLLMVVVPSGVIAQSSTGHGGMDERVGTMDRVADLEQNGSLLDSGTRYWQGQSVVFDGSRLVQGDGSASFDVWRVSDGKISSRVATFTLDRDGRHVLDTSELAGRFVIRYQDTPVTVSNGTGSLSRPGGSESTLDSSTWRVKPQTLEAAWEDKDVYAGQLTKLRLTSNREEYVVEASVSGLDFAELRQLFRPTVRAADFDAKRENDVILLRGSERESFSINTTVLPPGEHVFWLRAHDGDGSAVTTLTVNEPSETRFTRIERVETAGDLLDVGVQCGECHLIVGGPEETTLDVLRLRDRTGDGLINLSLNTRYAGVDPTRDGVSGEIVVYAAGDDSVDYYEPSEVVAPSRLALQYTLGDLRTEMGIESGGRITPMGPGSYDITLATSDTLVYSRSEKALEVKGETDVETFRLVDPSVERIRAFSAPSGRPSDLFWQAAPREKPSQSRAAIGDRLILSAEVSGLFGSFATSDRSPIELIADGAIELSIERLPDSSSSSAIPIDLERTSTDVRLDEANKRLVVILDTTSLKGIRSLPATAGRYRATLTVTGTDGSGMYPQWQPGTTRQVSTTVELTPPTATFESMTLGHEDRTVVITGTTNLAPGATLVLEGVATGPYNWANTTRVAVAANGSWQGLLDFSDAPGQTYRVSVSPAGSGDPLANRRGVDPTAVEPAVETSDGDRTPADPVDETDPSSEDAQPNRPTVSPDGAQKTAAGERTEATVPESSNDGDFVPSELSDGGTLLLIAVVAVGLFGLVGFRFLR